jgi:hypothetical protein
MILYFIFYLVLIKHFKRQANFKALEPSYLMSNYFTKFGFENLFVKKTGKSCFDLDLEHYFGINYWLKN